MLSFGIRFGEGFDGSAILKLMQSIPNTFDYDLVVIGSNPGGVACAREAKLAGKKTAIITWKSYSPAELEGFDEDLMDALEASSNPVTSELQFSLSAIQTSLNRSFSQRKVFERTYNSRKVRASKLDLSNELFKRGQQCRKLMHNAMCLGDLVQNAQNSGWRLTTTRTPLTINWRKMSEEIMDYVMQENWKLLSELAEEAVEIIEGSASFLDNHTLRVIKPDMSEIEFTADFICLALPTENILPEEVEGANSYGITCDDFVRMSEPPGKTLIVGALPESLEIAGIVACAGYPVTLVFRSTALKGYDREITEMIIMDLRVKGVIFKEETNLNSIEMTSTKKLLATFEPFKSGGKTEKEGQIERELFDTVVFAVGRRPLVKKINLIEVGIELDPLTEKIPVDVNSATVIPNIYVVGGAQADYPENFEISLASGKLLSKRLFRDEEELINYSVIPYVVYTPTEYAFVGVSEDMAVFRLGKQCVDVYFGYFKPVDFVIPPKKGECFAKVIVLKTNDKIIGLHFFGPHAGNIIQGFAAAMKTGLTIKNFQSTIGVTATAAQEILKLREIRTEAEIKEENMSGG